MSHWLVRVLWRTPARTVLSALVAGSAISLILVFEGFREGVRYQLESFPSRLPADLVVLESGVRNFAAARSILPQAARGEVEALEGVKEAYPLASIPVIFDAGGRRSPIQLVVHDEAGGPATLIAGRPCQAPGEFVLDGRLAREHGLSLGDEVQIMDHRLRLVGFSDNTSSPFAPYGFITYDTLLDMYFESQMPVAPEQAILLSALLVQLRPGAATSQVKRAIAEKVDRAWAFTPLQIGREDAALGERLLGPALNLLIVIAWAIALLTMSLMMYSGVLSRLREYGVQRAIGLSDRRLAYGMLLEAFVLVLLGLPVALLLARGIASVVEAATPLYLVLPWKGGVVLRAFFASVGAAALGTLIPYRRVSGLEPDVVFRGAS